MSNLLSRTRQLRDSFTEQFCIDHVIELEMIIVVLIKHNITKPQTTGKFATYFNKEWNLEIITKEENTNKKNAVLKYIQDKNDPDNSYINQIREHYNNKRDEIKNLINKDEKGDIIRYRKVEISLCNLINNNNRKKYSLRSHIIKKKYDEMKEYIVDQYHLDHIVELQILLYVLLCNEINKIYTASIFAKHFNKEWNFKILERKANKKKAENVTKWLKWLEEETNNNEISQNLETDIRETIQNIFDCYKDNRYDVNCIKPKTEKENKEIKENKERKTFIEVENYLYDILQKT